ncbi:hypothetical protein ACF07B_07920 [Streptomyces sp. NPDC015532]|uniref:hypothetical protein n=1 Tax=Streptomyces sp. NPDC015532 TaxID=3364960 RepID=UPI003701C8A2
MFTVPLAGGFAIVVHFNSGEEFTTRDYFLTHPDWSQDLVLSSDDQDRIGPGLCNLTPASSYCCRFSATRRLRRSP